MYAGKLIFTQVRDHLPMHTFRRCVQHYQGNRYIKRFSCQDHYRSMAFAQLTYRESLRDIEACLRTQHHKLYHMGIGAGVSRSTLAEANERRDWRIYADFAQRLIYIARRLSIDEDFGIELTGFYSSQHYPERLRRIKYYDAETDKLFVFLTNNFALPP